MNVGELIDLLSEHDSDTLVLIGKGYSGTSEVREVYKWVDNPLSAPDHSINAIIID